MKRGWVRVLAFPFVALALAQALAQPESKEIQRAHHIVRRGIEMLYSGDAAGARSQFNKALKSVPSFPDAHVGLGHIAMSEKRYADALAEYEAARKAYVDLSTLLYDLEMRNYFEAKRTLPKLQQQLIQLESGEATMNEADKRWIKTSLLQRIRDLEGMQTPVKEQANWTPAKYDFYVGNALSRLRRWDEAVEAYESCCRKNPEYAEAHHNIALAYWRTGKADIAMDRLIRAEQLGFDVNPRFKADLKRSVEESGADPHTP